MFSTALFRRCVRSAVALACMLTLLTGTPAAVAHVIVTPEQSVPRAVESYVLTVQSERPVPTTRITLRIPQGLRVVAFQPAPGWRRVVQRDRIGTVVAVTWSGGLLLPEEFAQFGLLARNPPISMHLVWKARQIYQDGFPVDWSGSKDSIQPAAFTTLSNATGVVPVRFAGTPVWASADLALLMSVFALVGSLLVCAALIVALRRVLV